MAVRAAGPFITEINPLPLFAPTGDVTRYFEERLVGVIRKAKRAAPNGAESGRTAKTKQNPEPFGYLRSSIYGELSHPQPLGIAFEVTVEARYAVYVIKGTQGPIQSKQIRVPAGETRVLPSGKIARGGQFAGGFGRLHLPPGLGYGRSFPRAVSGQKANDFLSRAVNEEAAAHSALLSYDRT